MCTQIYAINGECWVLIWLIRCCFKQTLYNAAEWWFPILCRRFIRCSYQEKYNMHRWRNWRAMLMRLRTEFLLGVDIIVCRALSYGFAEAGHCVGGWEQVCGVGWGGYGTESSLQVLLWGWRHHGAQCVKYWYHLLGWVCIPECSRWLWVNYTWAGLCPTIKCWRPKKGVKRRHKKSLVISNHITSKSEVYDALARVQT